MSIKDDPGVRKWTVRLRALKVVVPDNITPEAVQHLLESTFDNPMQQHAAVHFAIHVHSASRCSGVENTRQMGQDDPKSEQAAQ